MNRPSEARRSCTSDYHYNQCMFVLRIKAQFVGGEEGIVWNCEGNPIRNLHTQLIVTILEDVQVQFLGNGTCIKLVVFVRSRLSYETTFYPV